MKSTLFTLWKRSRTTKNFSLTSKRTSHLTEIAVSALIALTLVSCQTKKPPTANNPGANLNQAAVNACGNAIAASPVTIPAADPGNKHQIGLSPDGSSWSVTSSDAALAITYDNVLNTLDSGHVYIIDFNLTLNQQGTDLPGNTHIADIDVMDSRDGFTLLAGKSLYRSDFSALGVSQKFSMYFFAPKTCGLANGGIQGRVIWWKPTQADANSATTLIHASTVFNEVDGEAFTFAGNTYRYLKQYELQFHNSWAFATWVKVAPDQVNGIILGQNDIQYVYPAPGQVAPNPQHTVANLYIDKDGYLKGCMWKDPFPSCVMTSQQRINDSTWHHVGILSTSNTAQLFLDGSAVATTTGTINNAQGGFNQIGLGNIGAAWPGAPATGGGWLFFRGLLQDPRVYENGTTALVMQSLYLPAEHPSN